MVQDKDRIAVLHANGYDGVTKQTLSIARKPEKYALCLVPRARRLMQLAFPNDPITPEDARPAEKQPSDPTVRCKLPETRKAELLEALREDGYSEIQAGLAYIINMYLIRRKHEETLEPTG
jgi:hypothetical protein